jgi:hypothetical protein
VSTILLTFSVFSNFMLLEGVFLYYERLFMVYRKMICKTYFGRVNTLRTPVPKLFKSFLTYKRFFLIKKTK